MDEQGTFVGRQAELKRFREILEDPHGHAVELTRQIVYGYDPSTTQLQGVFEVAQRPQC